MMTKAVLGLEIAFFAYAQAHALTPGALLIGNSGERGIEAIAGELAKEGYVVETLDGSALDLAGVKEAIARLRGNAGVGKGFVAIIGAGCGASLAYAAAASDWSLKAAVIVSGDLSETRALFKSERPIGPSGVLIAGGKNAAVAAQALYAEANEPKVIAVDRNAKSSGFALLEESPYLRRRIFAWLAEPEQDQALWNRRYSGKEYLYGKDPVPFLRENLRKLPKGRALDLAAGEGRNAVFLAEHGFAVTAVDISPVGLKKAEALARERGVAIETVVANFEHYHLGVEKYDVIANFYFLQRSLTPAIKRALKPGGMVIYETTTVERLQMREGCHPPPTPEGDECEEAEHLLRPGELKKMFADFEILFYAETNDGVKTVASLIARKPARR